jgi:hypothetical protein
MAKPQKSLAQTLMNTPVSGKVEYPKPVPVGTYIAKIVGPPERGETDNKGTPFIHFRAEFVEPTSDVDEDALNAWAHRDSGEPRKLRGTPLPRFDLTYYTTEDAVYRLDKFFNDLGILEEGKERDEMADEAIGREFLVYIKHTPSRNEDDDTLYAKVKHTAPLSD